MGSKLPYRPKVNGMAAFNRHKAPSEEMEKYWKQKERLIKEIMKKHSCKESELSFRSVQELDQILINGLPEAEDSDEILTFN